MLAPGSKRLSSHRYVFDGGLVVRDGESGRIWLLQGEVAEACSSLPDAEIVALLADLGNAETPRTERAGQSWQAPDRVPPLDCALSDGATVLRVRVWDERLAAVLERMLAPLTAAGDPASTLDLFVGDGRTTVVIDGRITQDALGLGWWVLVRQIARSLRPGRDWLGVLHAATVVEGDAAIAIAGASGSGKTTLAGALLASGARLISDDATPIEAGTRLAWPCPLGMGVKQGSWPTFAGLFPDFLARTEAVRYGGRSIRYYPAPRVVPAQGYPVAALLFPTWTEGASFKAEPLRPCESLSLLAESGMMAPDPRQDLTDLLEWLAVVPAWRMRYADLDHAVAFTRCLAGYAAAPAR